MQATDSYTDELADLDKLAAELRTRGLQANLRTPHGRLPYLQVTNPHASILTEKVYAQAGAYWYSWAQRITDTDDPAGTAAALARVLAATDLTPSE